MVLAGAHTSICQCFGIKRYCIWCAQSSLEGFGSNNIHTKLHLNFLERFLHSHANVLMSYISEMECTSLNRSIIIPYPRTSWVLLLSIIQIEVNHFSWFFFHSWSVRRDCRRRNIIELTWIASRFQHTWILLCGWRRNQVRCLFSRSLRRWWVLRVVHYRRFFFWERCLFRRKNCSVFRFPEGKQWNKSFFILRLEVDRVALAFFFVSSCKHINGRVSSNMQKKEINKNHKHKTNIYLHSGWYGCALFPYVSQVDDYSRVTVPVVTIHFSCLNFLLYIVKYNPIFLHRSSYNVHHPI